MIRIFISKGRCNLFTAVLLLVGLFVATGAEARIEQSTVRPDSKAMASQPKPVSFADLVEMVRPAVVNISTRRFPVSSQQTKRRYPETPAPSWGGKRSNRHPEFEQFLYRFLDPHNGQPTIKRETRSLGSGFIIDSSGLVVTNFHVIDGADEIEIVLESGQSFPARVRGYDIKTDLALLEIEADQVFPHVEFGDSSSARVGDWVIAIGNPFGLGGTTTTGIISARGRDINSGPYDDYIQIDASINRGNSGGPLFNMDGRVIGVNSAIFSPNGGNVGIGFAAPSRQVEIVVLQLRDNGSVQRAWLGIQIQAVTAELAHSFGLKSSQGALVVGVQVHSPAADAGIEVGDIILEFNNVAVVKMKQLPRLVASTPIGATIKIDLWRERKEVSIEAKLQTSEKNHKTAKSAPPTLGLTLSNLDDGTRANMKIRHGTPGVLIDDVAPGSPAAKEGLRAGDVILQVGRKVVRSPEAFSMFLEQAVTDSESALVVLVQQRHGSRFVALQLS